MAEANNKIKVEIWSDVACPFCYIGKRKFEHALNQFPHKAQVDVVWHSFQLDPNAAKDTGTNMYGMLATKFRISTEKAKQMTQNVVDMGAKSGLNLYLDKAIPTNTLDAHRLIHLATKHGLQDKAEERLFSAYFTEGKHIGDHSTLIELGADIGLNYKEVSDMLETEQYKNEVVNDSKEGHELGLTGVPFFVINRKHGISGAQSSETFLQVLQNIWNEEQELNKSVEKDAACLLPQN